MPVVAIIPALNEEKTVGEIVKVVKSVDMIKKVIVVSDGSTDNTVINAKKNGAKVIALKENVGKGGAMSIGVNSCKEDIILFLDADLVGLTEEHVHQLLEPVINGQYQMSMGIFIKGGFSTDAAHRIAPFLTGQRAIKRELFNKIPFVEVSRYGVEMALTRYTDKNKIPTIKVKLYNLTHVMKENKLGFFKGFVMRLKMYKEIITALIINIIK
ncbi:MAG: glycosyltransferase family 2 protein [Bacilli bacterium]|nr:glycosyltransferase family 2 protein [Bacilli bacterium]